MTTSSGLYKGQDEGPDAYEAEWGVLRSQSGRSTRAELIRPICWDLSRPKPASWYPITYQGVEFPLAFSGASELLSRGHRCVQSVEF